VTPPAGRPLWVGTSWKMNKTLAEAAGFIDELVTYALPPGLQVFVLPAHTALANVRDRVPVGSGILLGAQNAHWGSEGAVTGEISMRMARDAGATLIEMGHSERREQFGETDDTVALKAAAAIAHGLVPLICVGEPAPVRAAGSEEDFVGTQVEIALSRLAPPDIAQLIIAYEPVWAIGEHGSPAEPEQIAPVMARISAMVADASAGGRPRALLYGGGVDSSNARALLTDPHTDGLFVGRAGWNVSTFVSLIELCAPYAPNPPVTTFEPRTVTSRRPSTLSMRSS
jgi:L-erythrulose 1-phosphate isomerase